MSNLPYAKSYRELLVYQEQANNLTENCQKIGRLLGGIIAKSHLFCGTSSNTIREPFAEYFTQPSLSDLEN